MLLVVAAFALLDVDFSLLYLSLVLDVCPLVSFCCRR